ncbi:MAG: SurA N-terminal domain-containing protein [Betaproteobacteria bacterium]
MFDAVRNSKRIVQIFLALITLPFAFWGVDSYVRNSGVGMDVASVGESKITISQFDQALRERQDRMRQSLGASFRQEMMNTPETRLSVLNSLIDQRLLMLEADRNRLRTTDEALRDVIAAIPALQENGRFSMERYEAVLRSQGMSQPQFEAKMRQDIMLQQLLGTVGDAAFVSATQAEALLRLQLEERQFAEFKVTPEQFADKIKIETTEVQKFYDDNKSQFEVAERVRAEYAILSADLILAQVSVDEREIKAWYEGHKDRYQQPEERRSSHILIVAKSDAEKSKAKVRAEEILKDVQKTPAKFAELAKQNSQDPGSAQNGGDLGFFGRGMMVKAFEDAVYKLKEGEVSGVVESEFGFHIIKLTGIKPAKMRSIEEVRAEIEADLKRQSASRKFAEAAETFTNTVYEQADSLQPAAEKFKLKIQQSAWIQKNAGAKELSAIGVLANAKVLSALFSDDAVKNKRNTEAVEIAPSTLLAARVLEHVPATTKPFETVKADIEKMLKAREAAALAKKSGEAKLAELKAGAEDKQAWSLVKNVSRLQGREVPQAVMQAVFKADTQKLPVYAGASVNGGYSIFKIVKVSQPDKIDPAKRQGLQSEYSSIIAQEDLSAFLNALRQRYKVEVNKSALESRER